MIDNIGLVIQIVMKCIITAVLPIIWVGAALGIPMLIVYWWMAN